MPTSEFSTSNVKDTGLVAFFEGAGEINTDYENTFDFRFDENVSAIRKAPWTTNAQLQSWDGKSDLPEAKPEALDPQLLTYSIFGLQTRLSPFDEEEIPNLVIDVLFAIGMGFAATAAQTAAAAKAAGFTIPSVHGGKTLYATDHPTKPGGTRLNKLSTGLDHASLNQLHAILETQQDFQGVPRDRTAGGVFIEYNPTATNRDTIYQAYRSQVTSAANQSNILATEDVTFIKNPFLATDKVIMGARSPKRRPYMAWLRKRPQIRPVKGENNELSKFNTYFAVAFSDKGMPDNCAALSIT